MNDMRHSGDDVTATWEADHPGWKVEFGTPLDPARLHESREEFAVMARSEETGEQVAGAGDDLQTALADLTRILAERTAP